MRLPASLCIDRAGVHGSEDAVEHLALVGRRRIVPVGKGSLDLSDYISKVGHGKKTSILLHVRKHAAGLIMTSAAQGKYYPNTPGSDIEPAG